MARVNIEDYAFGERRLQRLAQLLAWDMRTTLGCLAYLWHESQEKLRTHATAAELAEWCWASSLEEGERIVSALVTTGYISREGDHYKIHGNETQIENRVTAMSKAAKGGQATKEKWERIKAEKARAAAAAETPKASSPPPSETSKAPSPASGPPAEATMPTQCKAMQGKAKQGNANSLNACARVDPPDESERSKEQRVAEIAQRVAGCLATKKSLSAADERWMDRAYTGLDNFREKMTRIFTGNADCPDAVAEKRIAKALAAVIDEPEPPPPEPTPPPRPVDPRYRCRCGTEVRFGQNVHDQWFASCSCCSYRGDFFDTEHEAREAYVPTPEPEDDHAPS